MKLFISHSSKNANYGNALVELLTGIGVSPSDIIFSSNDAFGIPIGQNIFNWLKDRISEKPYVLYLLSPEYYTSVACLNEMGAAWIIESDHTMIFTPNFNLRSYEFQNGALDPREIGFYINNENKVLSFIESLKTTFSIANNPVLINQKVRNFIAFINQIPLNGVMSDVELAKIDEKNVSIVEIESQPSQPIAENKPLLNSSTQGNSGKSRFYSDLMNGKLKDDEALLAKYIMDTDRFRLGTGWQESYEVANIRTWEDINELSNVLSNSYNATLRRIEMKKLTEVSAITSHGNPKEFSLVEDFKNELLDPSDELSKKLNDIFERNKKDDSSDF